MKNSFWILVTIFFLVNCDNNSNPSKSNIADEKIKVIENVLETTVKENNIPGSVLLIKFEDGSIYKNAIGYSKIDHTDSTIMTIKKQFRIGSVTKTFIGTAILILVNQGKLNLNDAVENLLPGILKRGKDITLEMLLNQTSAIKNYTTMDEFGEIYFYQPVYGWTKEKIINLFKNEELLDSPGNLSYYSNSNYYLLGLIIEKYSGKAISNFLNDEIFYPLGMDNSYFPTDDNLNGDFAHGYFDVNQDGYYTEDEDYTSQNPYGIWASGGIVSTVDDLLIWANELYSNSLLSEDLRAARMKIDNPLAKAPEGIYYGLGIFNLFDAVGHNGAVAGYTTILYRFNNTIFIAFGNGYATSGRSLFADDLFEQLKKVLY